MLLLNLPMPNLFDNLQITQSSLIREGELLRVKSNFVIEGVQLCSGDVVLACSHEDEPNNANEGVSAQKKCVVVTPRGCFSISLMTLFLLTEPLGDDEP